ncbi:MAG: NAD(P)-binding domain-containing protein, partial [Longimicrobiales bacterium]
MPAWLNVRQKLETILSSGSTDNRRPILRKGNESNIKGLFVIGDLAGAPVIKLAMAQGFEVIDYIASLPDMQDRQGSEDDLLDVLVVGAGAAGLNAALAARDKGFKHVVLEKGKIANTIENFPEGKWVYAEPDTTPAKGKLWLDGTRKEDLIQRWNQIVEENELDVRAEEPLTELTKQRDGTFLAKSAKGEYRARKVVLATGQRGNPRKLGVDGEDLEWVYHMLYSPRKYRDESILVVGAGNSAVEAALTLSEANRVTIANRDDGFPLIFKDNTRKLEEAMEAGRIEVIYNSSTTRFESGKAFLQIAGEGEERELAVDHAFVLIGAELPIRFLKSLGIKLENEWEGSLLRATGLTLLAFIGLWFLGGQVPEGLDSTPQWIGGLASAVSLGLLFFTGFRGDRWSWLGISFFVWYSIYGIKYGKGEEFWPYANWGYETLSFFERPWSFWYTIIYTALMTIFGVQALHRWGLKRRDKFQIWRFVSLISFQWIFFFIVPEYLFQSAVENQWIGERLATDPQFADQAWRSYGLVYAWPLFFYTFFYDPHQVWVIWGVLLSFVVIPVFVLFNGKRYCSWICGCGGLAETFGDRWRHLAPKGKTAVSYEWMGLWILIFATLVTVFMLLRDTVQLFA